MCGITGILYFNNQVVDERLLKNMMNTLKHRGPDGEGFYINKNIGLGHRRLAIIDLSDAGKQPMCNEDSNIWVTYNGEIYNFLEIREQLEKKGHKFISNTDTEIILHSYEEWGKDSIYRFNGMFAFALWDEKEKSLWLARDRLGIKPLFYAMLPNRFLFGSEIKTILCDKSFERRINLTALHHYLSLNYTPAPYTLFENIYQLLPGHYLSIHNDGGIQDVEYWDLIYEESEDRSDAYYFKRFEELVSETVLSHLISDVPFGAFLSGGVDSAGVVYWMTQHLKKPVKTFSIGFFEKSYNELPYARKVANACKTEHYEKIIMSNVVSLLPKIVWHSEEPTADSSMIPMYCLSQIASQNVKMVLSGDGSDEIFAGYETYSAYYLVLFYQILPKWFRKSIISVLIDLLPVSDKKVSLEFKLKRFIKGAEFNPDRAHFLWRIIFDEEAKQSLYKKDIVNILNSIDTFDLCRDYFNKTNAKHPLNRMLYVDTRFYLPNDMLVKVDRMSMANSLEIRVPYLDHRLVEFAASVPPRLKLKWLYQRKYILRKSLEGHVPAKILNRKKQGFNIPKGLWIKDESRRFVVDNIFSSKNGALDLLKKNQVTELIDEHLRNKRDYSHQIWCLLILSLWWQKFQPQIK